MNFIRLCVMSWIFDEDIKAVTHTLTHIHTLSSWSKLSLCQFVIGSEQTVHYRIVDHFECVHRPLLLVHPFTFLSVFMCFAHMCAQANLCACVFCQGKMCFFGWTAKLEI